MTTLFLLNCIVTAVLLGGIVWLLIRRREQQARQADHLLKSLLAAHDHQKDLIFRNMHDHLNPMLRSVMRNMESHRAELVRNNLKPEALERDIDVLLLALNDIRSCTHGEVPASLKNEGLIATLQETLMRLTSAPGISAEFENRTAHGSLLPLDYLKQLEIYRICSELTENIVKHSSCTFIRLAVGQDERALTVELIHNGAGISNEQVVQYMSSSRGVGLRSCMSRAKLLKATIFYSASPGHPGVKLTVPVLWKNQLE